MVGCWGIGVTMLRNVLELGDIEGIRLDDVFMYYKNFKTLYTKGDNLHSLVKQKFIKTVGMRRVFDEYIINNFCTERSGDVTDMLYCAIPLWEQSLYDKLVINPVSLWLRGRVNDDGIELYRLSELGYKSLVYIGNITAEQTWKKLHTFFAYRLNIAEYLNSYGVAFMRKELNAIIIAGRLVMLNDDDVVVNFSNDNGVYCKSYMDLDLLGVDENMPTPAFDSFLRQISCDEYREAFMGWVYSIFVAENKGRQILYMDGRGKSGKSTIIKHIYRYLQRINPILVQALENNKWLEDKFSLSSYKDVRFVMLSDCSDRWLMKRDTIRQLTGGDVVVNRAIGKNKISCEVYAKIMVASNYMPFISSMFQHELTRIMYVKLDDKKVAESLEAWDATKMGEWGGCIEKELETFIKKCKPFYYKLLTQDGHNLRTPVKMIEDLQIQHGSDYYHAVNHYFKTHWVKAKNAPNCMLDVINVDFERFMDGFNRGNKKTLFKSYVMVWLRENNIRIIDSGMGRTLIVQELVRLEYQSTWQEEKELHAETYKLPS